jgi:2-methylisocitrate lyase-like PEP mutase family enzyme
MPRPADQATRFLALHKGPGPLLLPNPWDPGSAKLLAALGYQALATTSGGFAGTLGRLDGSVSRDEAIAHATAIVAAVDIPVSADLENGFADDPSGVAKTVELAIGAGLAGCSVEDFHPGGPEPIYPLDLARDRVAAAASVAHEGGVRLVLTARAENFLHGRPDLPDTIARLEAYQDAGADVLYAPGLIRLEDIRAVVSSVDRPVNVLALPGRTPGGRSGRGRRRPHLGRLGLLSGGPGRCRGRRPGATRPGHLRVHGPVRSGGGYGPAGVRRRLGRGREECQQWRHPSPTPLIVFSSAPIWRATEHYEMV